MLPTEFNNFKIEWVLIRAFLDDTTTRHLCLIDPHCCLFSFSKQVFCLKKMLFLKQTNKQTMTTSKPYFGRMGGKSKVVNQLLMLLPPSNTYQIYCEPFVGAGSFFLKIKRYHPNKHFVINDANQDIFSIWNDLQNLTKEEQQELQNKDFGPSKQAFETLRDTPSQKRRVDRLHRNLYLSWFSFNKQRKYFANRPNVCSVGKRFLQHLPDYTQMMEHVVVKNTDFLEVVKQFDHPNTFIYLDPPYHDKSHYYENQEVQTETLLSALQLLKSKWMLSYNEDETVEAWAREHNYSINHITMPYTGHYNKNTTTKTKKTELVITNY